VFPVGFVGWLVFVFPLASAGWLVFVFPFSFAPSGSLICAVGVRAGLRLAYAHLRPFLHLGS
jgi:hypothetical protein